MRILALDIGGGTQDILLFDSSTAVENCFKMVLPSPTRIVARRIQEATRRGQPILLAGYTMGGGPNHSALKSHVRAGLPAYATPQAARSFDDDLTQVEALGVRLVSQDEARRLRGVEALELRDVDMEAIGRTLERFGVEPRFDGIAVAVLDHGAAPPGVSDRVFRFQHLAQVLERGRGLEGFIYLAQEVPEFLTRMQGVRASLGDGTPLLLMDTGPAAVLGALEDGAVRRHPLRLMVNLGNMHTLALLLRGDSIQALLEHHTGLLTTPKLDELLGRLLRGQLTREEVFQDGGHGCLILEMDSARPFLCATGPRRGLMAGSTLGPYMAVPHGDMMLAGCFGLVRAFALKVEAWREEIEAALGGRNASEIPQA